MDYSILFVMLCLLNLYEKNEDEYLNTGKDAIQIHIKLIHYIYEMVLLKCFREKNKLRVKIQSPGYLNTANCQFPRDLREEGRVYECAENCISLAKIGSKFFSELVQVVLLY